MAIAIKYEIKALFFGLALLSYVAAGAFGDHLNYGGRRGLAASNGSSSVFDVNSYGAKSDGKTDNVQAFMKAWNAACQSAATAKLVIPTGTYLTGQVVFQGPCKGPGPITVEVQGTIIAQTDLSAYPSPEWFLFESLNGLRITGKGTFDGQGASVWKYNNCKDKSNCQLLPHSIKFARVNNAIIDGIKSINSKSFHLFINNCNDVTVQNVKITAPGESPNTDGIHISSSDLVTVTSTVIGTGDDCISVGQGVTNLEVSTVACGPGHGFSVGSLGKYPNERDVKGIIVRNCTLTGTTNGVRIKTWPGSTPSQASDIHFEDINMINVKNPIIIDQNYGTHSTKPSRVKISNVHYKNIKGSSTTNVAVALMCSEAVPCQGIQLLDINLSFNGPIKKNGSSLLSSCLHASVVAGGKQIPPACH